MDTPVNGQPAVDAAAVIQAQIEKPAADSKKWILIKQGQRGVLFIFLVSSTLLFINPAMAGNIATIASVTLAAWGALVTGGIGAIAAVDYRNSASLSQITQAQAGGPIK